MISESENIVFEYTQEIKPSNSNYQSPSLFIHKLDCLNSNQQAIKVENISTSGLTATTNGQFKRGEKIILVFNNCFSNEIPSRVSYWHPKTKQLTLTFCRPIKLIERIALNIFNTES